jgi:hypothetical protein
MKNNLEETKLAIAKVYYRNKIKRITLAETFEQFDIDVKKMFEINNKLLYRYIINDIRTPIINEYQYEIMKDKMNSKAILKIEAEDDDILGFLISENFNEVTHSVIPASYNIEERQEVNDEIFKPEVREDSELEKIIMNELLKAKDNLVNQFNQMVGFYRDKKAEGVSSRVRHTDVFCSACEKEIIGIRYLCKHCRVNFCEYCEEMNNQDSKHFVLKIRVPQKVYILGEPVEELRLDNAPIGNSKISLYDSKCLSSNLKLNAYCNAHLIKTIKLLNTGSLLWSREFSLAPLHWSTITGPRSLLRVKIEPGKDINIDVVFNTDLPNGTYKSIWQLCDGKDNFFGEKVEVEITLDRRPNQNGLNIPRNMPDYQPGDRLRNGAMIQHQYNLRNRTKQGKEIQENRSYK